MEEVKAKVDVEYLPGVPPEITKEKWKEQHALHFKLEPIVTPGWKVPFLPGPARVEVEAVSKAIEPIYVLDIETTGLYPTTSRIIAIGVKDLRDPASPVMQFFDEDEEILIREFVKWFKAAKPTGLVGWGIGFDTKHIFYKLCSYRLELKEWELVKYYDLMDLFRRGTETPIYTLQKPDSLANASRYLLGREKMLTGAEVLQAWKRKDYELILEHNANDVEIISSLWQLVQFVYGRIPEVVGLMKEAIAITPGSSPGKTAKCSECLSWVRIPAEAASVKCPICGTEVM